MRAKYCHVKMNSQLRANNVFSRLVLGGEKLWKEKMYERLKQRNVYIIGTIFMSIEQTKKAIHGKEMVYKIWN